MTLRVGSLSLDELANRLKGGDRIIVKQKVRAVRNLCYFHGAAPSTGANKDRVLFASP